MVLFNLLFAIVIFSYLLISMVLLYIFVLKQLLEIILGFNLLINNSFILINNSFILTNNSFITNSFITTIIIFILSPVFSISNFK
jgi:hypothetical protein